MKTRISDGVGGDCSARNRAQRRHGRLWQVFVQQPEGHEGLQRGQRPLSGSRWREAADRYEAVIAANPNTEAAPDFLAAYFFLGNSYDNLCKPARKGEPENDAYMTKAIENYTKAAELSKDPLIKRRSMEYIVAAYAPDKLNDPSQAEPIVQKMIQMDPNEPTAYFQLSKIYEDAGRYEEAEAALLKARDAKPERPDGLELDRRLLQPPGRVREDDGGLQQGRRARSEQPAGLSPDRQLLPGEGVQGLPADPGRRRPNTSPRASRPRTRRWRSTRTTSRRWSTRTSCSASRRNLEKDPAKQKELISQADQLRNKAMELQKGGAGSQPGAKPAAGAEAQVRSGLRSPAFFMTGPSTTAVTAGHCHSEACPAARWLGRRQLRSAWLEVGS